MFDLEAYLARIGLRGRPSVAEVHRAQATTIPFENLDPHCGIPVSLAIEDVERKLISRRRGGYCFELNLLLKEAFEALGAEVELFLARGRVGVRRGVRRPWTHLVLGVRDGRANWLADVGFGLGTLLEPVPLGVGDEHLQSGWRFRIVEDQAEFVLQTAAGDGWADLYGFVPEPVPPIDLEVSNWFASTYPRSPFVTGIVIGAHADDGSRLMLRDWGDGLALKEQTPHGAILTPIAAEAVPELLASRFGLPGYAVNTEGRLVPVAQA